MLHWDWGAKEIIKKTRRIIKSFGYLSSDWNVSARRSNSSVFMTIPIQPVPVGANIHGVGSKLDKIQMAMEQELGQTIAQLVANAKAKFKNKC